MNRRGEVEHKAAKARMPKAMHAAITQLLRYSDNETATVPREGKNAPRTADLAAGGKHSLRSTERGLNEAERHHWLVRYPSPRGTVAGQLQPGHDCDCGTAGAARACEWPPCGKPLGRKYGNARYCGDRCSKAARRSLARIAARAEEARVRDRSRDSGGDRSPDSVRPSSRDTRDRSPDKSQVSPQMGPSSLDIGTLQAFATTCQTTVSTAGRSANGAPAIPSVLGAVVDPAGVRRSCASERKQPPSAGAPGGYRGADDLVVSCPFCAQEAMTGLGVIQHDPTCWRGGMWGLYEAEAR